MKKIIASMIIAASIGGVAIAAEPLTVQAMDEVTAGNITVGGTQAYEIKFKSDIVSRPHVRDNTAGAGAVADAYGKNTLTEAKTYTETKQGYSSYSEAGSLSVSTRSQKKSWH